MTPLSILLKIEGIQQDHADYGCVLKKMYELKEYYFVISPTCALPQCCWLRVRYVVRPYPCSG